MRLIIIELPVFILSFFVRSVNNRGYSLMLNYFFLCLILLVGSNNFWQLFSGKEKNVNNLKKAERIKEKNNHEPGNASISSRFPKRHSLPGQGPKDNESDQPSMSKKVVEKINFLHR
jgi:hypothetical protein